MSGGRSVRIMVVPGVSGSHLAQMANEAIKKLEATTPPEEDFRIAEIKVTTQPLLAIIIYSTGESSGGFWDRRAAHEHNEEA